MTQNRVNNPHHTQARIRTVTRSANYIYYGTVLQDGRPCTLQFPCLLLLLLPCIYPTLSSPPLLPTLLLSHFTSTHPPISPPPPTLIAQSSLRLLLHMSDSHAISYNVMHSLAVSCYAILCHVMSCHVMSCHVMSCHVMSDPVIRKKEEGRREKGGIVSGTSSTPSTDL